MATTKLQQDVSAPHKSVWKKFTETNSSAATSQNLLNGHSTADEAHERDSVSSKDIAHGEGSSQGHSTPASSMTDEAVTINSPPRPAAPIPVYRPAPLPQVNPWKARQEEIERKRWKESQDTPPIPLQMDRVVPKPPTNASSKSGNKPNGVVKSDVKAPSRRSTKINNPVPPPALEDSEAWPSPDVAATVEKEDRVKSTSSTPTIKDISKEALKLDAPIPAAKESPSEVAKVSTKDAVPKEISKESTKDSAKDGWKEVTKESKKKKWEKIEVNFQYDSPQNRRGRGGGKFNRNTRGGARDSVARGKEGVNDRPEKAEKTRNAPRSDGEENAVPISAAALERRAQSLSFDPGHQHHDVPAPEWSMRPPYTQEPVPVTPENWQRVPSPPPQPEQPKHQTQVVPDVSVQRSRSPASSRGKDSSSPSGSKRETTEHHHDEQHNEHHQSPAASPNGQTQFSETAPLWDEQEHNLPYQNNLPYSQQGNQARHGNSRSNYNRTRNGYSPNAYPQPQPQPNQYVPAPPQQVAFQTFYPPMYPPPMQTGFPPNARAHSVPYYQPNSMSRYPQPGYPQPQWFPDYSRLGVQPVPVIDDDIKVRIIRQVDYYFSNENLFKDVFLRKKMDTQGFVPISALVQFHRLQVVTSDVPTVLNALLSSTEVEVLSNSERGPLVRARHDPTKWVYPMNDRDETAKHPGPSAYYFQAHQDSLRQMQDNYQYSYPQPYYFDAQYGFPSSPYRPHEQELAPPIVSEPDPLSSSISPHYDQQNRKLSGEASIFVPNGSPMTNGNVGAFDVHSMRSAIPTVTEEHDEPSEALDDDNLSNLVVIVTDPKDKPVVPALPMNGVKHEQEPHRSLPQPVTWRFSDVTAATQASTSVSIKSDLSSLTAHDDVPSRSGTGETALTEKNLKKQLSQSGVTESSYSEFRSKAIQSRQKSNPDSTPMLHLYQFWSDFLYDYWVPGMYAEFVHYAVEDANANRRTGLLKLFSLYERILEVKFRTSLWSDFVRLAGEDYRNGHLAGIESVWQIRGHISARGRNVTIQDGDVSRLVEAEIQHPADFDRLRKEVKPASVVLVPYTTRQGA